MLLVGATKHTAIFEKTKEKERQTYKMSHPAHAWDYAQAEQRRRDNSKYATAQLSKQGSSKGFDASLDGVESIMVDHMLSLALQLLHLTGCVALVASISWDLCHLAQLLSARPLLVQSQRETS